ncbi:tRNA lysidine(34) synthetase TilS [Rhodoferax saidenbachensis]|uniref:tRNA(Ile)-lysidine synthase n=1 Tax=Rhodoferax saidenbachensis TaxID=1484693 RepID=A0A1P8KB34_9BURK|nr:tRNA lysidine(34) synthetase TilS [Rhodoferax saidenbachensis]APW43212.1 tRNA lysidine(34) synthetase TilS [Rhodoferax saidenbachensis]
MTQSLDAAMRGFQPALPLAVGLSGGADSTALLLACARQWPGQVVAFHVNHGLQAAAATFEQHCQALCAGLNVPLHIQKVDASARDGQSPEDAARIARYKAFSALARMETAQPAIQSIAIAQHADDQVETLLLALSRGAGLAGLSAMPARWQRDGIDYHRPLLAVSAADIRLWLAEQGATFVDDPTNTDENFTRNRIRARLLPALQAAFPQFRDTFARSASHAAQAQALLDEVAQQDWSGVCADGDSQPRIKQVQLLSRARQANLLRHWLKLTYQVIPSTAQLEELLDQVAACTTRGHRIHIKVGQGFVQRNGPGLAWYNP